MEYGGDAWYAAGMRARSAIIPIVLAVALEPINWLIGRALDYFSPGIAAMIPDIPPYIFLSFAIGGLVIFLMLRGWPRLTRRKKIPSTNEIAIYKSWFPEGLYVGNVIIGIDELVDNLFFEFSIWCFNCTGLRVSIDSVSGYVYYESPTTMGNM